MEDLQSLGGHIELVGFKDVDSASMIVVKKMVGMYARKFDDLLPDFSQLRVTLKKVHENEASEKYEVRSMAVYGGKNPTSEQTGLNLFVVLDATLKKLEAQMKV